VYALGDLDPRRERYCEWHTDGDSVLLLYREFETPILFAAGSPSVLSTLPPIHACLLQIPESFAGPLATRLVVSDLVPVLRMWLPPGAFVRPVDGPATVPLGPGDEAELRALFADGHECGEEPDCFQSSQLSDGHFVGVRDDGRLVAAGGTHVYSAAESVGAIGNVYTRRSHRGRGLGAAVMRAIVERLLACGTATVALNVRAGNAGAIRLYERLGFVVHAPFWEGRASRQ
jgi:ribosomal protein S18 acetylase RimI-like enzyme